MWELVDDSPSCHPAELPVRIPAFREKGTDLRTRSVPIFAYSGQRVFVLKRRAVLSARSRIGGLLEDSPFTEILSLRPGQQVRQILDCSDKSEKSRSGKRREKWDRR